MISASLTVWTSSSTAHAESLVSQLVHEASDKTLICDSISIEGYNIAEITQKLNDAFDKLVTMTMADSTLHIIAVTPLYEKSSKRQIASLIDACTEVRHNITLHILGLCSGLSKVFTTDSIVEDTEHERDALEELKIRSHNATFNVSYTLIDDYASNGAPIGFSLRSISQYIALIQSVLMQDYYAVLSPVLLSAHKGENISIGVSTLSFERKSTVNQLLDLGFLAALSNAGINNKDVDLQKAVDKAESILTGIAERYPALYDRCIRPLYIDNGMTEGKAVASASKILDNDIENLQSDILSLLKDPSLTFPEKEAVLAMVLGRDNENLRGMQYQHDGLLLDDACEVPINIYVDAFNRCCKDSKLLPVRSDFDSLKKQTWNDSTQEFEDSPENAEALNPLSEIKRLKQVILNTTSFIREKCDEIVELQKVVSLRENVDEIRHKWRKPKGDFSIVEYKEQPLDDKYIPSSGLKIKDTVDLRKFFSPVKNQMNLGSCTSFAVVSMYEALMNRNSVEGENQMSPAYLYFYSNILAGRPGGGSNFHEQIDVLVKHGVCHDLLYPYEPTAKYEKPSDEAEKDAELHRVISAKQLPLIDETDKTRTLKHNHRIITSALSEGYPVGISLKIYDNFGKSGAFILHPDDSGIVKVDCRHAMVVVGYSEENDFYIVRNSWGEEFGDDGYCYVPTAYIDDPEYMNFACIITEISDSSTEISNDIPSTIANFAATETEIRIAALRNAIARVRVELRYNQELYSAYYKYYQRLVLQLTMPRIQNDIRSAAEVAQAEYLANVEKHKLELENTFVGKLKEYKKNLTNTILTLFAIVVVTGTLWYFTKNTTIGIATMIVGGAAFLSLAGYKWWIRLKRRELQEELDEIAVNAKRQAEKFMEMQIKFHVAGMWISRFHKLSTGIDTVYDRLISFNDSLRIWQNEYSEHIGKIVKPEGQMFRILDSSSLLDAFFKTNKDRIIKGIDLLKVFDEYTADINNLDTSHNNLRDSVRTAINNIIGEFNIANYLLGERYPYLDPVDMSAEMANLLAVGQPSYRNRSMNITTPVHIVAANVEPKQTSRWDATVTQCFPMRPSLLAMTNPNTLILLTIHPQSDDIP